MSASPATDFSRAFVGALIARGVTDAIISPGARSQALALACTEWEKEGKITLHVVIDERSAAFRALGLALETGVPALAISTSGSAPGHFLPAVMEAHHAGVPLMVVSADRPAELHGVGANQTTQQQGLFGVMATTFDATALAGSAEDSGVNTAVSAFDHAIQGRVAHVNVAFAEPLSSSEPTQLVLPSLPSPQGPTAPEKTLRVAPEPGTLVIAGHGAGGVAEQLAVDLGAPLIAEVSSGAHFGPHLLAAYRPVLAASTLPTPLTRVITVGRPTLSREVWRVLSDTGLQHIVLHRGEAQPSNPSRQAQIVDCLDVEGSATPEERSAWVKPWVMASRAHHEAALAAVVPSIPERADGDADNPAARNAFARQEMLVLRRQVSRAELSLALWEASWPHDRLVLGASSMIREMDRIVGPKNIPVFANRGLSGIDGTISTARGIAQAAPRSGSSGVTRVLLGDLAFLHDVGSLMQEPGRHDESKVHLFIANDGGGTIFDALEVAETAPGEDFDRVMFTPQSVNIAALAEAYGWEYLPVKTMGELAEALVRGDEKLIVDVALER